MHPSLSFSYHPAGGDSSTDSCGAGGGILIKLVSGDKVDGQRDLDAILFCFGHQFLDDAGPLLVIEGVYDERIILNVCIEPVEFVRSVDKSFQ